MVSLCRPTPSLKGTIPFWRIDTQHDFPDQIHGVPYTLLAAEGVLVTKFLKVPILLC